MDQTTFRLSANTLHCALELSKDSWLLAIQFRDREQPSLYPIEGGNTEKLTAKLTAARDCWAQGERCAADDHVRAHIRVSDAGQRDAFDIHWRPASESSSCYFC